MSQTLGAVTRGPDSGIGYTSSARNCWASVASVSGRTCLLRIMCTSPPSLCWSDGTPTLTSAQYRRERSVDLP